MDSAAYVTKTYSRLVEVATRHSQVSTRPGLPSLLLDLGLVTGPHPLATAVTKSWHLCTQLNSTSKA
jgi:hypothetical protein